MRGSLGGQTRNILSLHSLNPHLAHGISVMKLEVRWRLVSAYAPLIRGMAFGSDGCIIPHRPIVEFKIHIMSKYTTHHCLRD